ncbi:LINE-1 retrotransposable element ORF2 protein [Cucumis melo var. makuwa]|uniref:LINE-1 retrotransposable element ORF2 protein n=1 Tax=Cucumis melo var. makuwa TaxID=1194695 RepID=A0A5D3DM76_CUCMM|nr:LINE-1 retrotransposable element ORF2 protein [Cucumis melo var. makuwa]TYK24399.1 LINE-1 retrotransposable element ORF2 protein [Cucumis melo var. makuwa]
MRERSLWSKIKENLPIPRDNRGSSKPTWVLKTNKMFSIASAKRVILSQHDQAPIDPHAKLLNSIRKTSIPMKIKFFMWSLIHKGVNTMEVIQRR